MITYQVTTGLLRIGPKSFQGYSGHGAGLNNPAMETVVGVGPIPIGSWGIRHWVLTSYEDKGPLVAILYPIGHDAHKRSGFLVHGDNPFMNHTASDGCIIQNHDAREAWEKSGEMFFEVVR